jgi:SH3-like domain-containing protein
MSHARFAALLVGLLIAAGTGVAEDRGPVTNLPLPRFVSLKADEANARRGPGTDHRIDWVFKRRDMPLQVIAEFSNWRRVADRDGAGGWVHYTLLSGVRTVLIEDDMTALRAQPDAEAPANAYAEAGVIARLGDCVSGWCRLTAGSARGWAEAGALWGVTPGAAGQ